jgi:8-oxo-dGTP pyrophosphatase MutT (NUDIX family)
MRPVSQTEIDCAPDAQATRGQVAASKVFRDWLTRTRVGGIRVDSVTVLRVHRYGDDPQIRMIDLKATAYYGDETVALPGICFLRGDAVDVFTLLQTPDGEKHVVLVEQPRVAGAQGRVLSNPSGMVEDEKVTFAGLRELEEEIGDDTLVWRCPINPDHNEPHDMLADLLGTDLPALVSPGASDERVTHLAALAEVTPDVIERLQRRFRSDEGEDITVVIVRLAELLRWLTPATGSVDEKTLTAALLYAQCTGGNVYEV